MNTKRWIFASLGAFITVFILDMIIHGSLLMGLYTQTESVWRPQGEAEGMYWMMTVGQLLFGFVFALFYAKGYEAEKPGLGQGLRFGLYTGLLFVSANSFVWYVVLPIPSVLNAAWLASYFVTCLAMGAVTGLIYKT